MRPNPKRAVWLVFAALVFWQPPSAARAQDDAAAADCAAGDAAACALQLCGERALENLSARFAGVADLAARFAQESVSAGFPEPQRSGGTVEFARPSRMRWRYETPALSLVISDGRTLWLVEPPAKQVQVLPVTPEWLSGTALQLLLGGEARRLREHFTVSARACEAGRARLRLTPREAAHYEHLELLVEMASGELIETRVMDLLGGQTRVQLFDVRTNLAPPDARFRYTPAPDERVTRLEAPSH